MIEAHELRSQNKILCAFNRVETVRMILGHEDYRDKTDVNKIYKVLIGVEECGNQYNLAEIKPIPLTKELLLALGGAKTESDGAYLEIQLAVEKVFFEIEFNHIFLRIRRNGNEHRLYLDHINALHLFQNLYHTLTGREFIFPDIDLDKFINHGAIVAMPAIKIDYRQFEKTFIALFDFDEHQDKRKGEDYHTGFKRVIKSLYNYFSEQEEKFKPDLKTFLQNFYKNNEKGSHQIWLK